jgi:pyruvate dehydrogenase E2 component (dihydrolipoamide acetyltransferase)
LATKVIMPALGMAQETGKLIAWLKKEGESVSKGESIMEIETDKAVVEIEAAANGILGSIQAEVNQEVQVGTVIAWILAPGEQAPETELVTKPTQNSGSDDISKEFTKDNINISPVARNIAQENGIDLNLIKTDGARIQKADVLSYLNNSNTKADTNDIAIGSPKAKRLAKEIGLEIQKISGSGPQGAVLAKDVLSASESHAQSRVGKPYEMSKAWATMANRLTEAWQTIPHFYLEREVNASQLVSWRRAAKVDTDQKITFTDLLTKAVAMALKAHPRVNSAWINNSIQSNEKINVGLAVATDDGLVVPVIPNTDKLSIHEIAEKREGIVSRTMNNKLKMQDLQDGTFTISNLGMYGVDRFIAIVNPPQAAILAVGKIIEKAIPVNGQIAIVPMMGLSLSCDHRIIDGARGAKFLDTLANFIENPLRIYSSSSE